ncbi:MAG: hypothetical protein AB1479_00020 [Pseudomonadota bacterium]
MEALMWAVGLVVLAGGLGYVRHRRKARKPVTPSGDTVFIPIQTADGRFIELAIGREAFEACEAARAASDARERV